MKGKATGGGLPSASGSGRDGEAPFRDPGYVDRYEEDRYGAAFGAWLRQREVRRFERLLGDAGGRLLDAGGGTGKLARSLGRDAAAVTVCDISLPMLRRCRALTGDEPYALTLAAADLTSLPFADASFDVVVCSRVLMHVSDWRSAVGELCRVTRGKLALDFPTTRSVAPLGVLLRRVPGAGRDPARTAYRTLGVRPVADELGRHGFVVRRRVRGFVLPYALHRRVDRPELSRAVEDLLERSGLGALLGSPATMVADRRRPSDCDEGRGRSAAESGRP